MSSRSLEKAFTMSSFLAFLEFRSFRTDHPTLTDEETAIGIVRTRGSSMGLDFKAGLTLFRELDQTVEWELSKRHLRQFILAWIELIEPTWLRLIPFGREKLRSALVEDHAQCFREAGLFDTVPDDDTLKWWDQLANKVRATTETQNMERARNAERLSLEFEIDRMRALGISRDPRWVALDDNSLGYDILSYDIDRNGLVVSRLVEVKSRLSDSIYITRNEWTSVSGAAHQSVFHVWDLPEKRLHEYRVRDMEPHIPNDRGDGSWQDVRIALPD